MEKVPAKPPKRGSAKPTAEKSGGERGRNAGSAARDAGSAGATGRSYAGSARRGSRPADRPGGAGAGRRDSSSDRPAGAAATRSARSTDRPGRSGAGRSPRPAERPDGGVARRSTRPAGRPSAAPGRKNIRPTAKQAAEEPVRLNKYIANSGVCARREADELIRMGYITVNGVKVTEMGHKVKFSDTVEYKGKKLVPGKKVYLLLNKPRGYVTTVKDPHADVTVLDLVKDATTERIYPVGRLDKSTTGVLLLTNDGDLAGKLTHPSYGARKVYHVFTDKEVTRHDMETIVSGVTLDDDGKVSADAISYPEPDDHTQIGLEIHSGQNRVVRRIFEKLGYRVRKLDRVSFAGLTKKNLQRGHWRHLTDKEVSMLKRGIYK